MLTYTFHNKEPLYQQLYHNIKEDIMSQKLKAHDKLPSKRALSKHLHISILTIENAYMMLLDEGYIESIPRVGYFVSDIHPLIVHKHKNISQPHIIPIKKEYDMNFSSNSIESQYFPFSIWSKCTRYILSNKQSELLRQTPSGGTNVLREAISSYLKDYRDISVSPQQIIIGSGTEYLYSLLIQLFGYHQVYGMENPGYNKLETIFTSHQVSYEKISLDKHGIDINKVKESNIHILHITPSHHFPTGITMGMNRRSQLLDWAHKNHHYIIEDDYDSEFRLSSKPIPSLYSIDTHDSVIYMNTFTKSLSSTIRISYMVLPVPLAKLFYENLSFYTCTVPTFEQYTLAKFMNDGYFEKHINRMRNIYRKKRDTVLKILKESKLYSISTISEERSGLHFLLHLDVSDNYQELLLKNGIYIQSLYDYGGKDKNTFIINYSSLDEDKLKMTFEKMYMLA